MGRFSLRPAHLRAAVLVALALLVAAPGWGADKKSSKKNGKGPRNANFVTAPEMAAR